MTAEDRYTPGRNIVVILTMPSLNRFGNVVWKERHQMRGGAFPPTHPVTEAAMQSFRLRGYWASCFPEGDGMCFEAAKTGMELWQADVIRDLTECFGFEVHPLPSET